MIQHVWDRKLDCVPITIELLEVTKTKSFRKKVNETGLNYGWNEVVTLEDVFISNTQTFQQASSVINRYSFHTKSVPSALLGILVFKKSHLSMQTQRFRLSQVMSSVPCQTGCEASIYSAPSHGFGD